MQTDKSLTTLFRKNMRDAGLRVTAVRLAIFYVLLNSSDPLSVKEIVSKVNNGHFVSVYRSINALHNARIIKLVPRGFKNLYELSDEYKPHHHHATCNKCGKSVSIHDNRLEELMMDLSRKSGIAATQHTLEIYGMCLRCQNLR